MKIAILGTGYVGLSTGVCLGVIGHDVTCIDINEQKIKQLNRGISPIYEPELEKLLTENIDAGRLHFTTAHQKAIAESEVIIVAVGTPQGDDGAADLTYLHQAAKDIAANIKENTIVVIKSTVPIGTNDSIKALIEDLCGFPIKLVSNPEFLRQGSAIYDTLHAERIVIGSDQQDASEKICKMYEPFNVPIMITSIRSAEMIKYAANAFLATKISYINEMANLCEMVGANVEEVAMGMGKDHRIGSAFLQAGIGYGGSCFPKDVKALVHTAGKYGFDIPLLKETMKVNENQRVRLLKKALHRFRDVNGRKIVILGLAFKPETDDMREAPSITIAEGLIKLGAEVVAYDPVAADNARKIIGDKIKYAESIDEAVTGADAVMIVTEWKVFKELELKEMVTKMKHPIIFDGRNCYLEEKVRACKNIEYYPIGKPPIIQ